MANFVDFYFGTAAQYEALATKDSKTFYFIGTDLYFGEQKLNNTAEINAAVASIAQNAADIDALETAIASLTATQVQYKAAEGATPAVTVKAALDDLYTQIGEGGGVADQIQAAIEGLDSSASQAAGADGLALSITMVDGKVTAISGSIAANTYDAYGAASDVQDAITGEATDAATDLTLNGLSKKAAAAQSAAEGAQSDVDDLAALVGTGYGTKEQGGETVNKTVKEYIDDEISGVTGDATALEARVEANEDAIELLNKTDGTVGSVKKTVDDAIAAVVASAPEDFDTLKEMSDWIAGHEADASAMNSQIQANKLAIGVASQEASGDDPAVAATGLHKKIEDETARATAAEGALDTRVDALEDAMGQGGVAEQIADAIGALDGSAVIASKTGNAVTIKAGVSETDGVIDNTSGTDITLADVAATGAAADVSVGDAGNYFNTDTVEAALQELALHLTWRSL